MHKQPRLLCFYILNKHAAKGLSKTPPVFWSGGRQAHKTNSKRLRHCKCICLNVALRWHPQHKGRWYLQAGTQNRGVDTGKFWVPLLPLPTPLKKNQSDVFSPYITTYPRLCSTPFRAGNIQEIKLQHGKALLPRHSPLSQDSLCCQFTTHCWYQRTVKRKQTTALGSNLSVCPPLN